jgi:hypothetical protein
MSRQNDNNYTDPIPRRLACTFGILLLLACLFLNQKFLISPYVERPNGKTVTGNLPPALALTTVALGPLRGLIANGLWWRIIEQQDEGNFFEIIQLADWITVLQPRNAKVWTYQAWNMCYNVAYEFPDPESRWKWIYRAIKLLTGKALGYNPDNRVIKKEIARIYFERIGQTVDKGSNVFQRNWADMIAKFLPNGSQDELKQLAEAPETQAELRKDPAIDKLLKKAADLKLKLLDPKDFYNYENWTDEQKKLIGGKPGQNAEMLKIDAFLKAKGLEREAGVNPRRMLYIDEQYGPFDWRLYQAYAVYWAATGSFEEYTSKKFTSQPMIRQAMQQSFLNGTLIFDPQAGIFVTTNNFRIIGKLHDYYDYQMEHFYTKEADDIHKRFLEQAAAILYTFNKIEAAKEVFGHYKEDYSDKDGGLDFDTFIARSLYSILKQDGTTKTDSSLVEGALFQAYNWLATGDIQRATGYANFAKLIWKRNQKLFAGNPGKLLPPFDDLKASVFRKVMGSNIAPVFKQRLLKTTEAKSFERMDSKVYLGETVETGAGHRNFRKQRSEDAEDESQ